MEEVKTLIEELNKKHEESVKNFLTGHSKLMQEELKKINGKLDKINVRPEKMEERIKTNERDIVELKESANFTERIIDDKQTT